MWHDFVIFFSRQLLSLLQCRKQLLDFIMFMALIYVWQFKEHKIKTLLIFSYSLKYSTSIMETELLYTSM
jgi:hypothetical protein